jgi:hypothetical protein
MSIHILIMGVLVFGTSNGAESALVADRPTPSKSGKWSVTGEWHGKHPNWKDIVTLRADGTFARAKGGGGKWRLIIREDRPALELDWDEWHPEIIEMVSPDLFRGSVRRGTLELRRATARSVTAAGPKFEKEPLKEFEDPALKARLSNSTWRLHDGKQFTLRADGSTKGSWHNRKGSWRIVAPNKVQLTIMWRPAPPSTVMVEANGSVLRWSDSEWAQIAKRVESKSTQR